MYAGYDIHWDTGFTLTPGQIRYASDFDPTLAEGISGAIGFPLPTSQS